MTVQKMADVLAGGGPHFVYARYPCEPASVTASRHEARDLLHAWQMEDLIEAVQLVVSELVTNAVVHPAGSNGHHVTVTYRSVADGLRLEVRDLGAGRPELRDTTGPDDEAGRGLALVETVTDSWGVIPCVVGKCVWCEFSRLGARRPVGEPQRTSP